jgi:TRAP-type uncharacterized transport system substrate-binding protein
MSLALGFTSTVSIAQTTDKLVITTGAKTGKYYNAVGVPFMEQVGRNNATLLESDGSMVNLDRLIKQEANVGVVQGDAWTIYMNANPTAKLDIEILGPLYQETAQLLCNRAMSVSDLDDLIKKKKDVKIAIGKDGSGTNATWQSLVRAKKELGDLQTVPMADTRALGKAEQGEDLQCVFTVVAPGSSTLKNADEGGRLTLVNFWDKSFLNIKGKDGKPVYQVGTISYKTYKNLMPNGFTGRQDVETVTMQAMFVVSSNLSDSQYGKVDTAYRAMKPAMKKELGIE